MEDWSSLKRRCKFCLFRSLNWKVLILGSRKRFEDSIKAMQEKQESKKTEVSLDRNLSFGTCAADKVSDHANSIADATSSCICLRCTDHKLPHILGPKDRSLQSDMFRDAQSDLYPHQYAMHHLEACQ